MQERSTSEWKLPHQQSEELVAEPRTFSFTLSQKSALDLQPQTVPFFLASSPVQSEFCNHLRPCPSSEFESEEEKAYITEAGFN